MNSTFLSVVLLCLFKATLLFSQSDQKAILEIQFTGIRTSEGQIAIGINSSAKGWPHEPEIELQFRKDTLNNGELVVQIDTLSFGSYAISALDDLNSNIEMEMFLGIPKEGYGFTRNPSFKLRAPKFEECSFELNQPLEKTTIHFRYSSGKGKNR